MPRVVLLHVVPGLVIFLFYALTAPFLVDAGFPRASALLLGFVLVGMPMQLILLRGAAHREGKKSIRDVIAFRQPVPFWLAALLVAASIGLALALIAFLPFDQIATYLAEKVFWWAPVAAQPADAAGPVGTLVLVTLVAQILIDGLANPIVEELYFRGYLLPRLGQLGWFAPIVNTTLFTLAHLWQPYNYVTIFVFVLPLTLITWWRKNIYVQMVAHCLANTIGATVSLVAYLNAPR